MISPTEAAIAAELERDRATGWAWLGRFPNSGLRRTLDYLNELDPEERAAVFAEMASFASRMLTSPSWKPRYPETVHDIVRQAAPSPAPQSGPGRQLAGQAGPRTAERSLLRRLRVVGPAPFGPTDATRRLAHPKDVRQALRPVMCERFEATVLCDGAGWSYEGRIDGTVFTLTVEFDRSRSMHYGLTLGPDRRCAGLAYEQLLGMGQLAAWDAIEPDAVGETADLLGDIIVNLRRHIDAP